MAENREYGSFQQNEWPGSGWQQPDQMGEPRYQPPRGYNDFPASSWSNSNPGSTIPAQLFKRAEARVAAQKRFFKSLFIYMGVVAAFWLIGIATLAGPGRHDMVSLFVPLFVSVLGGIWMAWNFFNAFIWMRKSHEERIVEEARKMAY